MHAACCTAYTVAGADCSRHADSTTSDAGRNTAPRLDFLSNLHALGRRKKKDLDLELQLRFLVRVNVVGPRATPRIGWRSPAQREDVERHSPMGAKGARVLYRANTTRSILETGLVRPRVSPTAVFARTPLLGSSTYLMVDNEATMPRGTKRLFSGL